MTQLQLSIATTDYDHFRDFRMGAVKAEGIDLNWLNLGHHECFARFTAHREFDLAELSFAKFAAQVTRPDSDIIGLPVICSRLFRFSSFYIHKNSGIRDVKDLAGRRVGSPEWAHSAAVYMRGWMHNDMGVRLTDVHWVQAGANSPGRVEKVEINLPEGVRLTRVADKSLSQLLAAGEIDCAIMARPPTCFLEGHTDVVRLFPDFLEMEQEYYERTKVWPIMHIIAMQKRILKDNPWVARATCSTPSRNPSGAASSACSTRRCRATRWPGWRAMRARCATNLAATPFPMASKKTAPPGSRWRCTPTSRE